MAAPRTRGSRFASPAAWPWTRGALVLAIGGPALALGGVPPWVLPVFLALLAAAWWRLGARLPRLRLPWVSAIPAVAAALTLLQCLPLPGLREAVAPGLAAEVDLVLRGTGIAPVPGLSVARADTAFEAARLLGLTFLLVAAAQFSWRLTAAAVTVTGCALALLGLGHDVLGADAIFGLYVPRDAIEGLNRGLRTSFVNPNHQSGLLLLGTFCASALAVDEHRRAGTERDRGRSERHQDRAAGARIAAVLQAVALVLSLSRGALVVALLLGPVAAVIAGRARRRAGALHGSRPRPHGPWRVLGWGALAVVFLAIARHRALRELATVLDEPHREGKFAAAREALGLVPLSPWLGIGRGSFRDVFGAHAREPSHVVMTHLESLPIAMIVEWGPLAGAAMLVAAAAWWGRAFGSDRGSDRGPRRIALLGLLALALQNLGDFSLEFLGVAAPAFALLGALSPGPGRGVASSRSRWVAPIVLGSAMVLALAAAPGTWPHRSAIEAAVARGALDPSPWLARRPLDGPLHLATARAAADRLDAPRARAHAAAAARQLPGSVDAWLLHAAALARTGDREAERRALAHALTLLHAPLGEPLAQYLLARFGDPRELAACSPVHEPAFRWLVAGLLPLSPAHADAVAAARLAVDPRDGTALGIRGRIAREAGNAPLALHFARLHRDAAPELAASHLAVVDALGSFEPMREDEMVATLERALADAPLELTQRGVLEERLVRLLRRRGDPASLRRAVEVGEPMRRRPASAEVRRGRDRLFHEIERAAASHPAERPE